MQIVNRVRLSRLHNCFKVCAIGYKINLLVFFCPIYPFLPDIFLNQSFCKIETINNDHFIALKNHYFIKNKNLAFALLMHYEEAFPIVFTYM